LSASIVIVEGRGVKFSPMQRMGSEIPKNRKVVGEAGKCFPASAATNFLSMGISLWEVKVSYL
jgi:hypothetical protein